MDYRACTQNRAPLWTSSPKVTWPIWTHLTKHYRSGQRTSSDGIIFSRPKYYSFYSLPADPTETCSDSVALWKANLCSKLRWQQYFFQTSYHLIQNKKYALVWRIGKVSRHREESTEMEQWAFKSHCAWAGLWCSQGYVPNPFFKHCSIISFLGLSAPCQMAIMPTLSTWAESPPNKT